ncbi:glycoside hydrolase family 9 protein [Chryseolinea lacunae]|uniref:Glycoside hydrolase family 9 protein n=1 Tax=Chryseolinea lacunae TaxID=2801331 RepID=A0ABS1KZ84_9BACT|nr:glycoside hydrolase family 9 protein [Chryseolinea lacunae]MBL0743992.1 glycoside hydrolase family 9 protein [Chryseolinea lacunae]
MKRYSTICVCAAMCLLISLHAHAQRVRVLTNQIGYELTGPKHAVVQGKATDEVTAFRIKDSATDAVVFSGNTVKTGAVNKWKDWHFWTIDFDAVAKEGTYYIECDTKAGAVQSYPFVVQKDLLERNTLSNVVYYFKGQRSSGLLDKADRNLRLEDTDTRVDAHGGWFDATGDYGKHLSHLSFSTYFNPQQISITVWSLFKTYAIMDARNDVAFKQYKRKTLDEAMFGADYLVRVKNPKGSFYRSVSGHGPEKKPEDRMIGKDRKGYAIKTADTKDKTNYGDIENVQNQATYEVSYRAGAGVSIAALAMASTFPVSGDFSSADYLKAAEDAFLFLEKNNVTYTNDGKENILDDYCALMAATELFKVTKKPVYKQAADRRAKNLMARLTTTGAYKNYWRADDGTRPFFHAADAGLPVVSLVNYLPIVDEANRKQVLDAVRKSLTFELDVTREINNPFGYARQLVQNKDGVKRTTFFFPHDTEAAPWWQGENARLGSLATAARLAAPYFKDDADFYNKLQVYAWNQLNWILGLNPYDSSMLQGSGRNAIAYMFFGTYQYTNAPGGICNGITGSFADEDGIDYDLSYLKTGKDDDWRWAEQWLPHAAWYLVSTAIR